MDIIKNVKEFKPTTWAVNNRTAVYIFTVLLTLAGLYIFITIPKEQFPDIIVPTIFVSTIYPEGANPTDIENLITKPIENQLKSVNGIKRVTSRSIPNVSLVTAEFNTDIDQDVAKQLVEDAVAKAKPDLPTDLDTDPEIIRVELSEVPIMQVNISGEIPLSQLKGYAEDLEEQIEGLKEITRVDVIGAPKREIQINVDLFKMESAALSFGDVERSIASQNVNISAGELRVNELRRTMRLVGEFKTPEEINNLLIRGSRGNIAYLRDIAEVKDDFEEKQDFARLDGKTVITLNVIKRAGENLIGASAKIEELVAAYEAKNLKGVAEITITGDTADQTEVQLNDLINTVIIGFVLVLIVLSFFMGLQNAFFVALAVPLSTMIAFLFMPSLDFTLNVVVLFSLLLALGIIVDDAIVVIENTHRIYHNAHLGIEAAAKAAAGEVFAPVLAGTLTTIAPFVPLLFWPGLVGEFMVYLPITLILTLFASLLVAFVMNPVFAVDTMQKEGFVRSVRRHVVIPVAIFLGSGILFHIFRQPGIANFLILMAILTPINYWIMKPAADAFQAKVWPRLIAGYRRWLDYLVHRNRPYWVFLGTIALLFFSIFVFAASNPVIEFFPSGDPNFAFVYVKMPVGTDGSVTDETMKKIENKVYEVIGENNPNIKSVITNVGIGAGDPNDPDRVVAPHKGKITVAFVPFEDRVNFSTKKCLTDIRKNITGIPAAEISVEGEATGPPTGKPVSIEISGEDLDQMAEVQDRVLAMVNKSGIQGIEELKSDLVRNKPEITIEVDVPKAQAEGLSSAQIILEIRSALFGKEVSQFRDNDDDTPIMLRLDPSYSNKLEDLLNMNISFMDMASGMFRQVPISSLATIRYTTTYTGINRKNFNRVVTLSSNVLEGYNANNIVLEIGNLIKNMDLPEGIEVKMAGQQEDQAETANFLGVAFLGALALMFMILVTQFNSATKPFIIFSTVLFSLIGIFLGFAITHMPFSIAITGVGVFALAGIVIRNGILLLEFADVLEARGKHFEEAVIEAGTTRITPVFLTAICAILGLIPLAIGFNFNFAKLFSELDPNFFLGGDNVAFWGPLAWSIIYGLIVATFLTLLVVPCMLIIYRRVFKRKSRQVVVENLEPGIVS